MLSLEERVSSILFNINGMIDAFPRPERKQAKRVRLELVDTDNRNILSASSE